MIILYPACYQSYYNPIQNAFCFVTCSIFAVLPPMDSTPWHVSWGGCFLCWRRFRHREQGRQQWVHWGQQICKHQLSERLVWLAGQGLDCQVRFRCILSYLTDNSSGLKPTQIELEPLVRLGDGSTLRMHSAVLAAASPYFRTLGQVGNLNLFRGFFLKWENQLSKVPFLWLFEGD